MNHTKFEYQNAEADKAVHFVENLKTCSSNNMFDSAAASDLVGQSLNQNTLSLPKSIEILFDELNAENRAIVSKTILDGVADYEAEHDSNVPPDLLHYSLEMAGRTADSIRRNYMLDSATSLNSDGGGLQPNRAIVAVLSAMGAAAPWVHYLPADIGSRHARLAILQHEAGIATGLYAQNALMDGTYSGDAFTTSSPVHTINPTVTTGAVTGKVTAIQLTDATCDTSAPNVKLVRGRSLVYVNGKIVAKETDSTGSGASTVSGSVVLSGTTYQIGGTINTDTGAVALTTTPAMPISIGVVGEAFLDYERDSSITPNVVTSVSTYDLYAKNWRVVTQQSPEARAQMANELKLDPYSESLMAIQAQIGNERHYEALAKVRRLAANNTDTFDFDWTNRNVQLNASTIFNDVAPVLGRLSQQMANDTLSGGITHLYVPKKLAALIQGLPSTIFQSSGISAKPYVYRIGRLFNQYDVYFTPKGLAESSTAAQMLCIGRAPSDVTRNTVIMGDAVPITITPLGVNTDMRTGAAVFGVSFLCVNPHTYSANGAAMLEFTNLY